MTLAALTYELHNTSILSDNSYDIMCQHLHQDGCGIPGFDASTGMWAQNLITDKTRTAAELAVARTRKTKDEYLHGPLLREILDEVGLEWYERRYQ